MKVTWLGSKGNVLDSLAACCSVYDGNDAFPGEWGRSLNGGRYGSM